MFRFFKQKVKMLRSKPTEVKIPVGGITPDGVIYEKVVRPDGNEPIYKEQRIDEPTAESKEIDTNNK